MGDERACSNIAQDPAYIVYKWRVASRYIYHNEAESEGIVV